MKDQSLDDILKKLIAIPSVSSNLNEANKVIDAVQNTLSPTGVTLHKGEISGFPYLMTTTRKPNNNMIWFVCHLDVVPADTNLFTLRSDADNYYGRGVFDMKGMASAVIAAFVRLPDAQKRNVGLLFTTDEEIGGRNGVGALVDDTFKGAAAFVFDQSTDWVLLEKMKGIIWLEVTAHGKAAHGAYPWLGQSSNEKIIDYLAAFRDWYNKSTPKDDSAHYYTTVNIGTLHGGETTNQVSDTTIATIDVRFADEHEASRVMEAAESLAQRLKSISIRKLLHEPSVNTDVSEKWFTITASLMQKLGLEAGPNGQRFNHGSTDGRFFSPYKIPVITTRPSGDGQHGPKEWVSKKGLYDLERLAFELMSAT